MCIARSSRKPTRNGQQVLAHLGRTSGLEDAKDLFRAGIDGFVHTVRDRDVDQEYLDLVRAHPKVWTGPNVPGPGMTANDLASLSETLPSGQIEKMRQDIERSKAAGNKAAIELFMLHCRNLRKIHDAGMTIGLGTDGTGNGFGAHEQLAFYTQCGMSPREAIVAATGTNARTPSPRKMGRSQPARKPASSCWMRIRWMTSSTRGAFRACTSGASRSIEKRCARSGQARTSGRNSRYDPRRREARCSSSSGSCAPSSTTTTAGRVLTRAHSVGMANLADRVRRVRCPIRAGQAGRDPSVGCRSGEDVVLVRSGRARPLTVDALTRVR